MAMTAKEAAAALLGSPRGTLKAEDAAALLKGQQPAPPDLEPLKPTEEALRTKSRADYYRKQMGFPLAPVTRAGSDSLLIHQSVIESLGLTQDQLDQIMPRPPGQAPLKPIKDPRVLGILPAFFEGNPHDIAVALATGRTKAGVPVRAGAAGQYLQERFKQNLAVDPTTDPRFNLPASNISDWIATGAAWAELPGTIAEAFADLLKRTVRDATNASIKLTNRLAANQLTGGPDDIKVMAAREARRRGEFILPDDFEQLAEELPFLDALFGQRDVETFDDVGLAASQQMAVDLGIPAGPTSPAGPQKSGQARAVTAAQQPIPRILGSEALAGISEFLAFPVREALNFYTAFSPDPRIASDAREVAIEQILATGGSSTALAAMALRGGSEFVSRRMEARARRAQLPTPEELVQKRAVAEVVEKGVEGKLPGERSWQEIMELLDDDTIQNHVDAILSGETIADIAEVLRPERKAIETWFADEMRYWLLENEPRWDITAAELWGQLERMDVYQLAERYNAVRYGEGILQQSLDATRPTITGDRGRIRLSSTALDHKPVGSFRLRLMQEGLSPENALGLMDRTKTVEQVVDEQLGIVADKDGTIRSDKFEMVEDPDTGGRSLVPQEPTGLGTSTPHFTGSLSHVEALELAREQAVRRLQDHMAAIDEAKRLIQHEGVSSEGADLILKDQITIREALEAHMDASKAGDERFRKFSQEQMALWPEEVRQTFAEQQRMAMFEATARIREIIENSEPSRDLVIELGDPAPSVPQFLDETKGHPGNRVSTGQLARSPTPAEADWTMASRPVSASEVREMLRTAFGGLPIVMEPKFLRDFRRDPLIWGFYSHAEQARRPKSELVPGEKSISEDIVAVRSGFSDMGSLIHEVAHFIDRWFIDFLGRKQFTKGVPPFQVDPKRMRTFDPTEITKLPVTTKGKVEIRQRPEGAERVFLTEKGTEIPNVSPAEWRWIELKLLDYDRTKGRLHEGWAEFVRLWAESNPALTRIHLPDNPNVLNRHYAPHMARWFEQEFLPANPWLAKILYKTRELATAYAYQGDLWRFDQRISRETRKKGFIASVKEGVKRAGGPGAAIKQKLRVTDNIFDDAVTVFANDWHPLYQYETFTAGRPLPLEMANVSPSKLADVVTRTSQAKAFSAIFDGPRDFALQPWTNAQGRPIPGLAKILRGETTYPDGRPITFRPNQKVRIDGRDMKLVDAMVNFGVAQSIKERFHNGQKFTDIVLREADAWIAKAKDVHRDIPEVARQVTEWGDAILRYFADAGGMGANEYAAIKAANQHWFYLKRVLDDAGPTPASRLGTLGRGLEVLGTPLKRAFGSDKPIVDPLESFGWYAQQMIAAADRIRTARSLLTMKEAMAQRGMPIGGGGKLLYEVQPPARQISLRIAEQADLQRKLADMGYKLSRPEAETVFNAYLQSPRYVGKDANIIHIFDRGKLRTYQAHPALLEVFRGTEAPLHSTLMWMLSGPTKLVRLGATGLRASFTLANMLRDGLTFAIHSEYARTPLPIFKAYLDLFSNSENFKQFKAAGLEFTGIIGMDRSAHLELVRRMMADSKWRKTRMAFAHPIEALRFVLAKGEMAPRMAEFSLTMKKLRRKHPELNPDVPGISATEKARRQQILAIESIRNASDVTVNFRRAGSLGFHLNSIYAFWNAAVQGSLVHGRKLFNNPLSVSLRAMAYVTLPSILNWHNNKDKDWYKKMPAWERYGFYHIDLYDYFGTTWEDGRPMRLQIPYPFEIGYIWGAMPVIWMDQMYALEPNRLKTQFDQIERTMLPTELSPTGAIPTAFRPLMESFGHDPGGRSYFLNRSLYSFYRAPNEFEFNQFYPWTTETAKWLSKSLNEWTRTDPGDPTSAHINIEPWAIENMIYGHTGGLGMDMLRAAEAMMSPEGPEQNLKSWTDYLKAGKKAVERGLGVGGKRRGLFSRFVLEEVPDEEFFAKLQRDKETEMRKWVDNIQKLEQEREKAQEAGDRQRARDLQREIEQSYKHLYELADSVPDWLGKGITTGPITRKVKGSLQ